MNVLSPRTAETSLQRDAYALYGDPQRPAILFVHGIRLGHRMWESHARALSDEYFVVTTDLPGHGALADVTFSERNVDQLLRRLIGDVIRRPPLIVGYSLGGYVAMLFGAARPELTSALLLADCTLDLDGWRVWPYTVTTRFAQALPERLATSLTRLALRLSLPKRWFDVIHPIPFNRDVFTRTEAMARDGSVCERITAYAKPVLIVNGEFDLAFRMDEKRFLYHLPQAHLRIIRRADHTAPMTRSDEFVAVVREFAHHVYDAPP